MDKLRFYSVSDEYINYLRSDPRLYNVIDNKAGHRVHTRKYLGIVLRQGALNYFVPLSSPKHNDYIVNSDGSISIRKSMICIIRMTTKDTLSGEVELKGTLRLSNMIPVPESELTPYNFSDELDLNYRQHVSKEYAFVQRNQKLIKRNAAALFWQKAHEAELRTAGKAPNYLSHVVDFTYAEQKCREYIQEKELTASNESSARQSTSKSSVRNRLAQLQQERQSAEKIIERSDPTTR